MYEGRITGIRPPTVPVGELGLLMTGGVSGEPADGSPPGPPAALDGPPPAAAEVPPADAQAQHSETPDD
jgi:hypothetical protein